MPTCPKCKFNWISTIRSTPQNNAYFGLIIEPLAEYLARDKWEVHELCKHKFLREVKFQKRLDGAMEELEFTKSTTSLTTVEFNEYCSQIRIWASFLGCWLAEPNEVINDSNLR